MHGLINRSIEGFLRDTYGDAFWAEVAEAAGVDVRGFQTMRQYPDTVSYALINNAAMQMDKPETEMLDDLGGWLVRLEPVRRLLRFSGNDFSTFLHALEELQGRAHMVIPDLGLPRLRLERLTDDKVRVLMPDCFNEWRHVMAGMVRGMADDYGALALISVEGSAVQVHISHQTFSEGRRFELGAGLQSDPGGAT